MVNLLVGNIWIDIGAIETVGNSFSNDSLPTFINIKVFEEDTVTVIEFIETYNDG